MKVVKWKSRNLLSHLYSLILPERHTKSPTWFCLIKVADSFILSSPIWKLPLPPVPDLLLASCRLASSSHALGACP